MKKTEYFSGMEVLEDHIEHHQTSKEESIKERNQDFFTEGIYDQFVRRSFTMSVNGITTTIGIRMTSEPAITLRWIISVNKVGI